MDAFPGGVLAISWGPVSDRLRAPKTGHRFRDIAGGSKFDRAKGGESLPSNAFREERAARLFARTGRRQSEAFFTRAVRRSGNRATHRLRQCLELTDGARDRSQERNGAPARDRGESPAPDSSTIDGGGSPCCRRRSLGLIDRFSCQAAAPLVRRAEHSPSRRGGDRYTCASVHPLPFFDHWVGV